MPSYYDRKGYQFFPLGGQGDYRQAKWVVPMKDSSDLLWEFARTVYTNPSSEPDYVMLASADEKPDKTSTAEVKIGTEAKAKPAAEAERKSTDAASTRPHGMKEGETKNAYYHRILKEKAGGHAINEKTDIAIKGPRFFTITPLLEDMAKRIDVDVDYLLTLASHESGWLDDDNTALNNLFGVNVNGGRGNRNYLSLEETIDNWVANFGDWVRGSKNMEEFIHGLRYNGKWPYNSADPDYDAKLRNQYKTILKRKPEYSAPN